MAYIYTLEMGLATKKNSIDLRTVRNSIDSAVTSFNNAGAKAKNKKRIQIISVEEKSMVVSIESVLELSAPAKSTRYFSQILLEKEKAYLEAAVTRKGGQLFRCEPIGNPISDEKNISIQLAARDIEDSELICALVRFISNRESSSPGYDQKVRAILSMKQLALESGLIVLDAEKHQ